MSGKLGYAVTIATATTINRHNKPAAAKLMTVSTSLVTHAHGLDVRVLV
jgi:hypothetical protein